MKQDVHIVSFSSEEIKLRINSIRKKTIYNDFLNFINEAFPGKWRISLSNNEGEETFYEKGKKMVFSQKEKLLAMPLMQKILEKFPDAELSPIGKAAEGDYALFSNHTPLIDETLEKIDGDDDDIE